jgi:hypothetical protein
LYEKYEIALNLEKVDDDYFKLIVQPSGKVFSVTNDEKTLSIEIQESNNDRTQHWDIIPTGEKDYFRIKTRSQAADHIDYMFLQVADNDTIRVDLARRNDLYLGQQWRFV